MKATNKICEVYGDFAVSVRVAQPRFTSSYEILMDTALVEVSLKKLMKLWKRMPRTVP